MQPRGVLLRLENRVSRRPLRRVQLPAVSDERQLMATHDTFAAHADMATVGRGREREISGRF